jgi:signal peptidase II
MNVRARAAVIIAAVVLLDRATKLYIRAHVSPWDTYPVIPKFFNIVHTENPGAAFGMLSDSPGEWRGFLLVGVSLAVMIAIAFMLWRAPLSSAASQWGLSLVFGGALGNVWDRMFRGTVTDFLQFFFGPYEFPAFNAADSAITIGAGLLLIDMWKTRRRGARGGSLP